MAENKAIMPMADYKAICDAVREKIGTADTYKSGELATEISSIEGGGSVVQNRIFSGHIDKEALKLLGWTDEELSTIEYFINWDSSEDELYNNTDLWEYNISGTAKNESIAVKLADSNYQSFTNNRNIRFVFFGDNLNLTNYYGTFFGCYNLLYANADSLSFDNATNVSSFFRECTNLQIVELKDKNFPKVTSISQIFQNCRSLRKIDISGCSFDKVSSIQGLFADLSSLVIANLSNINFKTLTQADRLFNGCYSISSVNFENTDLSNVSNFSYSFNNCNNLNFIYGIIDVSSVLDGCNTVNKGFYAAFNCTNLKEIRLKNLSSSISFSSNYLSKESILYLFSNAKSVTSGTITLGATNLAKLTDDEKAIATNKGWTLA